MTFWHTRGQGMVEFALIVPVFLALIFATLDTGRAVVTYNLLSNVARDGARYAIIHGVDSSETCSPGNIVMSSLDAVALSSAGPFASDITVTLAPSSTPCSSDTYGTYYTVTATNTFHPMTLLVVGGGPISLSASSKMYLYTP